MKEVTAAIMIDEGKILIARRAPGEPMAGNWEFPGGKIEPGETGEQCLAREMKEEFGITVSVEELFAESIYEYENGVIKLIAYFVTWQSGELRPQVHDSIKWVTPGKITSYELLPADVPIAEKLQKIL